MSNVQNAIEHIYPLVSEFSKERTAEELVEAQQFTSKTCKNSEEESSDDDDGY